MTDSGSDPFAFLPALEKAAALKSAAATARRERPPHAYQVQTIRVSDAAAIGYPTSGIFRAREGLSIKSFSIWHQPCGCCGEQMLLLAEEGQTPHHWKRCLTCKEERRRAAERDKKRRQRAAVAPDPTTTCVQCGQSFTRKRSTATFCSTKCRVANHRVKSPAAVVEVIEPEVSAAVEPAVVVRRKAPSPAMRKVAAEMLRGFAASQREDADCNDPETAATCRSEAQQAELAAMKLEHPRQAWEVTGMAPSLLVLRAEDAEGQAEGLLWEGSIGDTFKGAPTEAEAKQAKALLAEAKAYRACAEWLLVC